MKVPFIGPAYEGRSKDINTQRCINFYVEIDPAGGKNKLSLVGTPGLKSFSTSPDGPVRGSIEIEDRLYIVAGNKCVYVNEDGVRTEIGTLDTSTGRVSMASDGTQVGIVDGTSGYYITVATNAFVKITDADFPGGDVIAYQDGRFIVNVPDTRRFAESDLNDVSAWTSTRFGTKESNRDNVVSVVSDHSELFVFGSRTTEIWYNAAASGFSWQRIEGAPMEVGCAAPHSVAKADNSVIWLTRDDRGQGYVVRANGYTPQKISTPAIEYQISQYSDISDAFAYAYQQDGHLFYVLQFPTGDATWVYDFSTGFWHERANYSGGVYSRHNSNSYSYYRGRHIVGDVATGNLYELDMDTYTNAGEVIRRLRRTQHLYDERKRVFWHELEVELESGVGLEQGQGVDPQAMLRWSNDGGYTWSNEHWASMGKQGEYGKRVIWRRLGSSRDRVFELVITDPVKCVIVDAYAKFSIGNS